jgi:hypothetical protein
VNNQGVAAGFYWLDGVHQHGFLLNDVSNNFQLLADPSVANLVLTQFLGINDNGEGYYQTTDGSQHGFTLQHKQRSYSFLDDPNVALSGVSITQITGINDSGESPDSMRTRQAVCSADSTPRWRHQNQRRYFCFQADS